MPCLKMSTEFIVAGLALLMVKNTIDPSSSHGEANYLERMVFVYSIQLAQRGCINYMPKIKFFLHWSWGIPGGMGMTSIPVEKALAFYQGE